MKRNDCVLFRTWGFQENQRSWGNHSSTYSYGVLLSQSIQVTVKISYPLVFSVSLEGKVKNLLSFQVGLLGCQEVIIGVRNFLKILS